MTRLTGKRGVIILSVVFLLIPAAVHSEERSGYFELTESSEYLLPFYSPSAVSYFRFRSDFNHILW